MGEEKGELFMLKDSFKERIADAIVIALIRFDVDGDS